MIDVGTRKWLIHQLVKVPIHASYPPPPITGGEKLADLRFSGPLNLERSGYLRSFCSLTISSANFRGNSSMRCIIHPTSFGVGFFYLTSLELFARM